MATETNERIEALRESLERAHEQFMAARTAYYEARGALDEAEGKARDAEWSRALARNDNEACHRYWLEDQARKVLAGGAPYGDLSEERKAEIAAEVERLRGEVSP